MLLLLLRGVAFANIGGRRIQYRGAYIGDRSQFEERSLQEYIEDRNMMSIPRWELEFPEWTQKGLDAI